jgi:hypothetical protein
MFKCSPAILTRQQNGTRSRPQSGNEGSKAGGDGLDISEAAYYRQATALLSSKKRTSPSFHAVNLPSPPKNQT